MSKRNNRLPAEVRQRVLLEIAGIVDRESGGVGSD
ncbi:MAG: hypothetical protein DDT30_01656 [Dehalococcoidia bacterium]|nr:hypothetical protein [Bacillota bacterium]MBT9143311.1 hypothetical protein [Bacillota bacterium]